MARRKDRLRISYDSPFRRGWDTLSLLLSIIFLRNSLLPPANRSSGLIVLEAVWFTADIALTFRTAMLLRDGRIVMDLDTISKIYLSLWFWVDLALLLPWRPFSTMMTLPPPPHKSNNIFSRLGRTLQGVGQRAIKVKNAVGDRIPRALRPSAIRRFLRLTDTLDVPRVEGVKTIVKHKSWIRKLARSLRLLLRCLRSAVFTFIYRVWSKLRLHLGQNWSPWDYPQGKAGSPTTALGHRRDYAGSTSSNGSASGAGESGINIQRWIRLRRRTGFYGGLAPRRRTTSSGSKPASPVPDAELVAAGAPVVRSPARPSAAGKAEVSAAAERPLAESPTPVEQGPSPPLPPPREQSPPPPPPEAALVATAATT